MGRPPRSRSHASVVSLLAMVSAASALSLSNFQLITSAEVPLRCIIAYDSPISGCSTSDFTQGNTCSTACKNGLQKIENTLTSVCGDANVPSSSVLGVALSGGLVGLLCPSGETSASAASLSSSSTPAVVTTQTTRHIGTFSSIPTSSTQQTSTTTSSSPSSSSSTDGESPQTENQTPAQSTQPQPQPTETTQTTQTTPAPAVTSSVDAKSAHTTSTQQTTAAPQATSPPGAASPFDIASPFDTAAEVSESQRLTDRWSEAFLFVNVFIMFLLLR